MSWLKLECGAYCHTTSETVVRKAAFGTGWEVWLPGHNRPVTGFDDHVMARIYAGRYYLPPPEPSPMMG